MSSVPSYCATPKRRYHMDAADHVRARNNRIATSRQNLVDLSEKIFDEFDSTSITSEPISHKHSKKSWFLRSLKKCSIRRKKNKNHTMTTPEESYELSNDRCINTCDISDELKNDRNDREVALEKRSYVLDELVKTERDYVRDLSLVVKDYIEVIRDPSAAECNVSIPENLKITVSQNIIFCNIEQIYEWHKNVFLKEIENCSAQPLKISNIFKKNESKFYIYINYCQKSEIFDCFMNEYREFFEEMRKFSCHMYPLRDLLIRPVKRIMTYTLLLREMLKYSIQANLKDQLEDIQQAIDVMSRLTRNIDEMMVVDRLRDFNGSITAQGKLLMHGSLKCTMNPGSGNRSKDTYKDLHVFLFEYTMIFAAEDEKKKKSTVPSYFYKTQITLKNMAVKEKHDSSSSNASNDLTNAPFHVESVDPALPKKLIVCQAPSAELRDEWLNNLQKLLQAQRDFQAALQMPILSVQNTKQMLQSSRMLVCSINVYNASSTSPRLHFMERRMSLKQWISQKYPGDENEIKYRKTYTCLSTECDYDADIFTKFR